MKKRNYVTGGHIILAVVELILLLILAVLSMKKNNLHYDNVEKFCYNIQEAGKLILPDYSLCEKYLIEKDRYGSIIITVTGKEGEQVSCEMTPDYQIVDKIIKTTDVKLMTIIITIGTISIIICIVDLVYCLKKDNKQKEK